MNYEDLLNRLREVIDPDTECAERVVLVVDEEGFFHVIKGLYWDVEAGCFLIRTEFKDKNGDIV